MYLLDIFHVTHTVSRTVGGFIAEDRDVDKYSTHTQKIYLFFVQRKGGDYLLWIMLIPLLLKCLKSPLIAGWLWV